MRSKPPISDSALTYQQQAPHLRRQHTGGGANITLNVPGSGGVDVPDTTTLAEYTGSSQSFDVVNWSAGRMALAVDTAVVESTFVDLDPFSYTPDNDTLAVLDVVFTSDVVGCVDGFLVAGLVDGRDCAISAIVGASGSVAMLVRISGGSTLTVEVRGHSVSGEDAVVTIDDVLIRLVSRN